MTKMYSVAPYSSPLNVQLLMAECWAFVCCLQIFFDWRSSAWSVEYPVNTCISQRVALIINSEIKSCLKVICPTITKIKTFPICSLLYSAISKTALWHFGNARLTRFTWLHTALLQISSEWVEACGGLPTGSHIPVGWFPTIHLSDFMRQPLA